MNERQCVTIGIFGLTLGLLGMAVARPGLWEVEVYKVIIQAVVLTGLLNMVLAFHFSSNNGSETARVNTGKAFEAITATAQANNPAAVTSEPQLVEVVNADTNPVPTETIQDKP